MPLKRNFVKHRVFLWHYIMVYTEIAENDNTLFVSQGLNFVTQVLISINVSWCVAV